MTTVEVKQSLFELVAQSNGLTQMIIEAGGELSPELEKQLTQLDLSVAEKVDGYNFAIDRLALEASHWKSKADFYLKIAKACETAQARIKDSLKKAMLDLGKTEIQGNDIRYVLSNTQPKLELDEKALDPAYKMEIRELVPDKERIKLELKRGAQISGAKLIPGYSLRPYANKKVGAK
jgi:hypothetical protein